MSLEKQTVQVLKKYKTNPDKSFGQNFLINQLVLDKIIEIASIKGEDVIEVGPGLGTLSRALLSSAKSLQAYEVDQKMQYILHKEILDQNFKLMSQDFLKAKFDWTHPRPLVSNVPYNITSKFLMKLFDNTAKFTKAVLMLQSEVVDRLVAKVGSKNYSALTVTANYHGQISSKLKVKAQDFWPAPKVDSQVVIIEFDHESNSIPFVRFIKQCFTHRRKTLFNNLKTAFTKGEILTSLTELDLSPKVRPQEVSLKKYQMLYKKLYKSTML